MFLRLSQTTTTIVTATMTTSTAGATVTVTTVATTTNQQIIHLFGANTYSTVCSDYCACAESNLITGRKNVLI